MTAAIFSRPAASAAASSAASSARPSLIEMAQRMIGLWRQRRALARLDDAQLADIGVTYEQAMFEAARPVWDAPKNWRA